MFTIPLGMIKNSIIIPVILTLTITGDQSQTYTGSDLLRTITPSVNGVSNNSIQYNYSTDSTFQTNNNVHTGEHYVSLKNVGTTTIYLQAVDTTSYTTHIVYSGSTISNVPITVTPAILTLTITGDQSQTYTGALMLRTITPSISTNDTLADIKYILTDVGSTQIRNGTSTFHKLNTGTRTIILSSANSNYDTNILSTSITITSPSPITGYRSTTTTGINTSFAVANGYKATFSTDSISRGGGLNNRLTNITNEQILKTVSSSDLKIANGDNVNNIEDIISSHVNNNDYTTASLNSLSNNGTDDDDLFFNTWTYGWGFETQIDNNNITNMTVSKFHFRNGANHNYIPDEIILWGKEHDVDTWIKIATINPNVDTTNNKRGAHSEDSNNTTTYFKYFQVFFAASVNSTKPTQMSDFWIEGEGYKLNY